MNLDRIEEDLLGDFAQDDHSLYEVFEFVRSHRPEASVTDVLAEGRRIIETWVERGWLQLAGDGAMWGAAKGLEDIVPLVDRVGVDATRFFVGSPWLRLTARARADVPWLRKS